MIRTNDYAKLSANAYDGSFIPRGYTLVDQSFNTESGFAAFAYRHVETGEIVIAIRGTELTDVGDLRADADIATGKLPQQYNDALAFYKDIARDNPNITISLTGHPLGGASADKEGRDASGRQTGEADAVMAITVEMKTDKRRSVDYFSGAVVEVSR